MKIKELMKHPVAFIVFGATGDLTQNKLYPALYELAKRKMLPKTFFLYGISREKMTAAKYKQGIKQDLKMYAGRNLDRDAVDLLLKKVHYLPANLHEPEGYHQLEKFISREEAKLKKAVQRIFYLALPTSLFEEVIAHVKTCKAGKDICTMQNVKSRIVLEKPFGHDFQSAKKLDKAVSALFDNEQIYRIDHYLGKRSFQTMFALRFANQFFEEHWDNKHIESIQINALETVGTEGRFSYYDSAGALKDMVQSHLLQFVAYLMMDRPKNFSAKELRNKKAELLKKVKPHKSSNNIIHGQYRGYRSEKGVKKGTMTETFVACKFQIDSPRWKGVPIYIRTGKNLSRKETSAIITYKSDSQEVVDRNMLSIQIAPNPGIALRLNLDKQGFQFETEPASMHYCRFEQNDDRSIGDYERLLLDVMAGDQQLFTGSQEVLASWKAIDPFVKKIKKTNPVSYMKGSDGPAKSADILDKDDQWGNVTKTCNPSR